MTAGKTIAAVESVKAAAGTKVQILTFFTGTNVQSLMLTRLADVYSPVTGDIVESNSALGDDPSLINQSGKLNQK
jgi:glycine cleavage system H lipoate-binding protein